MIILFFIEHIVTAHGDSTAYAGIDNHRFIQVLLTVLINSRISVPLKLAENSSAAAGENSSGVNISSAGSIFRRLFMVGNYSSPSAKAISCRWPSRSTVSVISVMSARFCSACCACSGRVNRCHLRQSPNHLPAGRTGETARRLCTGLVDNPAVCRR